MSTQIIQCPHCDTDLAVLKTTTGTVKPLQPDMADFQLGEAKNITCPGCGEGVPIK